MATTADYIRFAHIAVGGGGARGRYGNAGAEAAGGKG